MTVSNVVKRPPQSLHSRRRRTALSPRLRTSMTVVRLLWQDVQAIRVLMPPPRRISLQLGRSSSHFLFLAFHRRQRATGHKRSKPSNNRIGFRHFLMVLVISSFQSCEAGSEIGGEKA